MPIVGSFSAPVICPVTIGRVHERESLYQLIDRTKSGRGLPLLILPQGADQYVMGECVLAAGVGLRLVPSDVNPTSVRARVLTLLEEPSYRPRVAQRVC